MNHHGPRGKITTEVAASDRSTIARLIEDCGRYEGLYFPASVEVLLTPSENKPTQVLHYEDDILTGFAFLQHGPETEIYGVVHPDHRRKEEHWPTISLDVETKNANALGLYESCGFRTIRTYDYYQVIKE